MMKYLLLLLIGVLTISACGDSESTNACEDLGLQARIVYGTACSGETRSPIARLELLDGDGDRLGYCSGALVAPDRVLTAAHCVLGEVRAIRVELGGESFAVNSFAAHPNNRVTDDGIESSRADIAILALARRTTIAPLPINQSAILENGVRFSVFGFGLDQDGDAGELRSGEMFIEDATIDVIRSEHIEESSGICFGDSGGPAILVDDNDSPSVIGVASAIEPEGLFDSPIPRLPFPFQGDEADCELGAKNYHASIQSPSVVNFLRETVPDLEVQ